MSNTIPTELTELTELTDAQQREIRSFVMYQLSELIDESLTAPWLITDEMMNNDEFDVINAKKSAAIQYIKSLL